MANNAQVWGWNLISCPIFLKTVVLFSKINETFDRTAFFELSCFFGFQASEKFNFAHELIHFIKITIAVFLRVREYSSLVDHPGMTMRNLDKTEMRYRGTGVT